MIQKYKDYTPQVHETCYIAPGSSIIGNVEIGKNSSVWHNAVIRGDIEKIIIGEDSNIQDCCTLHCIHGVNIKIGDGVSIGHGAILHSCIIGDGSLIGMGAIVLDNVTIGKSCLIGAGAVVTPNTKIPDGSLVLGSPARVKRSMSDEEILNIKKNSIEYVELAADYKLSQQRE